MSYTINAQIDELEKLGYFKYANPKDIPEMKAFTAKSIIEDKVWDSPELEVDGYYITKCYRFYILDFEDLFEKGGIEYDLSKLKFYFEKIGVPLTWKDERWYEDEEGLYTHDIIVNDTRYILYKDEKGDDRPPYWNRAARYFALLINNELEKNSIDDKLYLIAENNDGMGLLLTPEQFKIIDQLDIIEALKPRDLDTWTTMYLPQHKNLKS